MPTRCFWPPESCAGVGLGLVGEADQVEQFEGLAGALRAGDAEDLQRQLDVVLDGARGQQVEVLEDHADAAARLAQFLAGAAAAAGEGGEVLAGDGHGAGGGALQEVDAADEGGLAGAALADDAVHLALADVQVDAVEGGDLAAARAVDLGQARSGDHRGFRHCRVHGAGVRRARGIRRNAARSGARTADCGGVAGGSACAGQARSARRRARTARLRSRFGARGSGGGPQKAHIRHIQRAPGVVIASVARVRLLVVVMAASKADVACGADQALSE